MCSSQAADALKSEVIKRQNECAALTARNTNSLLLLLSVLQVSDPPPPHGTVDLSSRLIARTLKSGVRDDNETSQLYTQVLEEEGTFVI